MNLRLVAIALMTTAMAGCQSVDPRAESGLTTPHTLQQAEVAAVQQGVRAQLGDSSATFGEMKGARMNDQDVIWACGLVSSEKAIPDMPAHFMASMLADGSVNVFGVGRNQDQTIEISHACARFGMEVFIPW